MKATVVTFALIFFFPFPLAAGDCVTSFDQSCIGKVYNQAQVQVEINALNTEREAKWQAEEEARIKEEEKQEQIAQQMAKAEEDSERLPPPSAQESAVWESDEERRRQEDLQFQKDFLQSLRNLVRPAGH